MTKITLDPRNFTWQEVEGYIQCFDDAEMLFQIDISHSVQEATLRSYMTGLQRGIHRGIDENRRLIRRDLGIAEEKPR